MPAIGHVSLHNSQKIDATHEKCVLYEEEYNMRQPSLKNILQTTVIHQVDIGEQSRFFLHMCYGLLIHIII